MRIREILHHTWDRIAISPNAELKADEQRQCRQLSALILSIIVVGASLFLSYTSFAAEVDAGITADAWVTAATLSALFVLYVINRRGGVYLASRATIVLMLGAIFASAALQSPSPAMLHYLAIPTVLSGLLLTVRFTAIAGAASSLGVLLFPLVTDIPLVELPVSATILMSFFVIVAARGRNTMERERTAALVESQARYHHLATHDSLTDLPNRLLFDDRLGQALARQDREGGKIAVVIVDIDNFRSINDALTQSGGDEVLKEIAERLKRVHRGSDTVARRGADEYSVLVQSLEQAQDCHAVVRKIQAALAPPFQLGDREVFVTASMGAGICPDDSSNGPELLRMADTAMVAAKRAGKNTYTFYSATMSRQTTDRLELASSLRYALRRDEMQVLFQPQVHSGTGEIVGVECLLRWHHPSRGLISPAVFIPIAEETGVITELTQFVVATALHAMSHHGLPQGSPKLSVNISAHDLRDDRFPSILKKYLDTYRVDPGLLELELTENIVFREIESAGTRLRTLKDLGVRVAVDDFGSGYSTLRQLAEFPIDALKIDRSFTLGLTQNPQHQAIVAGIMEISRRLEIDVIAEGVETEEQLRLFRRLGCELIQGWYYSRALDRSELAALLSRIPSFAPLEDLQTIRADENM